MRLKKFSLPVGTQVFKSLSDESRIRILYLIYKKNEMCISDLEHILDFTQTKTSRHITYLKNSGILNVRKQDQWVFYFIKDELRDIIKQIFSFFDKDQLLLLDIETYNTLFSNRELSVNKLEQKTW
ncbi:MAG: metalloregulator ArsR/SmtB family transcription factor [Cyclobacteriaceae bacterium]|nr:metalloregulator ArsR/SmtB family transcription factor [Cyclobacteriaceae bacterium]